MHILILNGPNLNLQGQRQPEIYGHQTFEGYFEHLKADFPGHQFTIEQSNYEGALVEHVQNAPSQFDGIVLNAAAYTHTSVALADAVSAIQLPVVEVHISNVAAREDFRRHSYIAPHCVGSIAGFGLHSYQLGVEALLLHTRE